MKQGTPLQPRQGASRPLQSCFSSGLNELVSMLVKSGMTHVEALITP